MFNYLEQKDYLQNGAREKVSLSTPQAHKEIYVN